MKLIFWLFIMVLLAPTAYAETRIEVDSGVCDHLVNYVEPPGVEYQPGVDATGNPVAPADVGGGAPIKLPTKFTIPITDYLYNQLATASGTSTGTNGTTTGTPTGSLQPALTVGVVTFDTTTNQISFNGQPLNGDPDGALGALCRKARATP